MKPKHNRIEGVSDVHYSLMEFFTRMEKLKQEHPQLEQKLCDLVAQFVDELLCYGPNSPAIAAFLENDVEDLDGFNEWKAQGERSRGHDDFQD